MQYDVIDEDGNTEPAAAEAEKTVRAIILYNTFDHSDRTIADLVWVEGRTVAEYLEGLPEDQTWAVCLQKGGVIERENWGKHTLEPGHAIVLSLVPNKQVALIFAVVALFVLTIYAGGIGGFAAAGLGLSGSVLGVSVGTIIGSVLVAAGGILVAGLATSLNSSASKGSDPGSQSNSYGLDGPKNTSSQQIPVPVVYGTFRMAGNLVNQYIENNPDQLTQTLFQQYVISEGEITGISAIQINDVDIAFFTGCSFDWRPGTQTQDPMQWFSETITPFNVQAVIVAVIGFNYTTPIEVDRIRLDFEFPNGLYQVNPTTGALGFYPCAILAAYKPAGQAAAWTPFDLGAPTWQKIDAANSTTGNQLVTGLRFTVMATGNDNEPTTTAAIQIIFRVGIASESGAGYIVFATDTIVVNNIQFIDASGNVGWRAGNAVRVYENGAIPLASYDFALNFTGAQTIISGVEAFFETLTSWNLNVRGAYRVSVTTPPLPRGAYDIMISRPDLTSTTPTIVNDLTLVDVNCIQDDLIAYANTAYYGMQIRIGEQINSIPQVTALVQGRKVNIYDRLGGVGTYAYSNNPADIALDILLRPSHRYAISATRIDFASFDNWRQYCVQQSLFFNGPIDTQSNVWDSLLAVMRVGRASPVLQGMRWAVLVEAPADPVMMFTQDNIVKDSFTIEWTGRSGRANLVEIQYFDENDSYKQHSAFALDETFVSQGDALIQSTVQLIGCTSAQQAINEAWLSLNLNRYLTTSVTFDVFVQAMGCVVGDVIYVQHDMPAWGYSAMISAVDPSNNSVMTIDSDIPWNGETDWHLLLLRSVCMIGSGVVQGVSGTQVQIGSFSAASVTAQDAALIAYAGDAEALNPTLTSIATGNITTEIGTDSGIDRIMIDGQDYDVQDITVFNGYVVIATDRPVTAALGDQVQFFKTDLMCDAPLAPPALGTHTVTALGWSNHPGNPRPGDRVMLGQVNKYKKPFRIIKVEYTDTLVRTINAIEYNETVYGPNATPTPNYSALSLTPYQVLNLTASQGSNQLQGGALQYYAQCTWDRPLSDPRGYAGAKVYLSLNFGPFNLATDLLNPGNVVTIAGNLGDLMRFKVVAHENDGETADYNSAPIVGVTIGSQADKPVDLSGVTAVGGIRQITLTWNPVDSDYVSAVEITASETNNIADGFVCFKGPGTTFTRQNLPALFTEFYWLRTISISGAGGNFTGPYSATTSLILVTDLDAAIAGVAKYAQTIVHPNVVDSLPTVGAALNDYVVLSTDGRLYQWDGTEWVAAITMVSVTGQLTDDQIAAINATKIGGQLTAAQIESITAAQLTGQITTTQITPNAITTPLLAAGAVEAANIAAGAVTTAALSVGSPSNVCWNSCWEQGSDGWETGGPAGLVAAPTAGSIYDPSWLLKGFGSGYMFCPHMPSTGANNFLAGYDPNVTSSPSVIGIPWSATQTAEVQARLIPLGCAGRVLLQFLDASNNVLSTVAGNRLAPSPAPGGQTLDNYQISWLSATPPAGTVFIRGFIQGYNDGGADIPAGGDESFDYVFFTQFSIGAGVPNATMPQPWQPGGVTSISGAVIKTGTLNADKIVGSSVTAAQIAGSTITGDKIAGNTISGDKIAGNTITGDKIVANTITAANIAAGAIGADEIAANSIHASMLASDFQLTESAQIGTAVIGTAQIGNLIVGTSNLQDNSVTTFVAASTTPNASFQTETDVFDAGASLTEARTGIVIVSTQVSYLGPTNFSLNDFITVSIYANGALLLQGDALASMKTATFFIEVALSPGLWDISVHFSCNDSTTILSQLNFAMLLRAK